MQRTLILLAFALSSLPAARAADCSSAGADQTTLSQCAGADFQRADAELNTLYRSVQKRLANSGTKKLAVNAQKAWLTYRDAECSFSSSGVSGGSIYPMVRAQCLTKLTQKRVDDFKAYLSCEEGDMSCPVPAQ